MNGAGDVFKHLPGDGWLVIVDELPAVGGECSLLADHFIRRINLSNTPMHITPKTVDNHISSALIDDLEIILDSQVETVDLADASLVQHASPGLILLWGGGDAKTWIASLEIEMLGSSINNAICDGALLFSAGGAASALGSWAVDDLSAQPIPGLDWLPGAIVLPWINDPAESNSVRELLAKWEAAYALGLAKGRLFAFGPHGQVEVWGGAAPTVVLGSDWG